ncbi:alpha/beta hydrolase [Rhizobium daejeonense]|uniref:Alpha/beta hydrolase n=1 Tax=Rhizobium daejeonense TaxID=240521 RepID=A0A6M1SBV3_9HYPH|nr:alpha/beta hydrolase [Rhizobium daejeonense]NGO66650.1 alpha/beta hydrolase [Rhizobium daejeonense]
MSHSLSRLPTLATAAVAAAIAAAEPAAASRAVQSRTVKINGVELFYREAGPSNAPTVLLLHGFPSSSHMFRNLIPQLSERYHVIAPDYPGFGYTVAPADFSYTFASIADLIDAFTQTIGVRQYTLFVQDYGGPVGFRLAVKHPERLQGLVIQNAVANVEGWSPDAVKQLAPFWKERNTETEKPIRALLTADTTRFQYEHGTTRPQNLSPDAWTMDQAGLDRPGNDAIQLDYFFDYQNNVAAYPAWGEFLKQKQPPTLIVWGRNDPFFTLKGVEYFRNLLPNATVHDYDAGHFALETYGDEIAAETLRFLDTLPDK